MIGDGNTVIRNLNVVSNDSGKVVRITVPPSIKRIENIHQTGGSGELWCQLIRPTEEIGETTRGGEIVADRIEEMFDFRDLTADVTVTGSTVASGLDSIVLIHADRDILNDIDCNAGNVGVIRAERRFGASTQINVRTISGNIDTLRGGEMNANIDTDYVDGSDLRDIRRLETTGENGTTGDWTGALKVRAFAGSNAGVRVFGNQFAHALIHQDFAGSWIVGDSYDRSGVSAMSFSGGLSGQMVINQRHVGGEWVGGIQLSYNGSNFTLTGDEYTNTAASLGGGSIGLAPFHLHEESCSPAHDGSYAIFGSPVSCIGECCEIQLDVRLRFYGPITLHDAPYPENPSPPFYVWKYVGGVQQWNKVDWPLTVSVDTATDAGERVMRIQSNWSIFPDPGLYRITRNGNRITCKGVGSGTEPAVADFEYHITLIDDCGLDLLMSFDLNSDQSVNGGDIGAWAATPVDFNQDSATDTADLGILVNAINTFSSLPK